MKQLRKIDVIHPLEDGDLAYLGWVLNPTLVMELDNEGPMFSSFEKIEGDAVHINDAVARYGVNLFDDDGKVFRDLGADKVANMTIADFAQHLLTIEKGRNK